MFNKGFHPSTDILNTLIGKGTDFKGVLHTQGSVHVEGHFEGEINAKGEVFVAEKSKVKANIFAKRVVISGEVIGNIETVQGLEISKMGRVYGNISGDRLIIEEGAIYKGKVNMDIISSQNQYEGKLELLKSA